MTKPTGRPRGRPRKYPSGASVAALSPAATAASATGDAPEMGAEAPEVAPLAAGFGPVAPGVAPSGRGRGRPSGGESAGQLAGTLGMALGMLSVFVMLWLCRPDKDAAEAAALTADEARAIGKPLGSILWRYLPQHRKALRVVAAGDDILALGAAVADYGLRVAPIVQAARSARSAPTGPVVDATPATGPAGAPATRRPLWRGLRRPATAAPAPAAPDEQSNGAQTYGPLGPILAGGAENGNGSAYPAHLYAS